MNTKVIVLGAAGVAVVLYLIGRSGQRQQAPRVNPQGGQLAPSNASGGTLASLGAWFSAAQQLVSGAYDPNAAGYDRNTPAYNPAVVSNPVSPSPAILPYSYKQATIDVPSLLGTDDLFTPGPGSAGGYAESGDPGTAAGPTAYSYGLA